MKIWHFNFLYNRRYCSWYSFIAIKSIDKNYIINFSFLLPPLTLNVYLFLIYFLNLENFIAFNFLNDTIMMKSLFSLNVFIVWLKWKSLKQTSSISNAVAFLIEYFPKLKKKKIQRTFSFIFFKRKEMFNFLLCPIESHVMFVFCHLWTFCHSYFNNNYLNN
jgi:hypothetical protein